MTLQIDKILSDGQTKTVTFCINKERNVRSFPANLSTKEIMRLLEPVSTDEPDPEQEPFTEPVQEIVSVPVKEEPQPEAARKRGRPRKEESEQTQSQPPQNVQWPNEF